MIAANGNKAHLTLIGAGPGDPQLITLKAVNALASADVVLYDALINKELLAYAPVNVPKIYVGKRADVPSLKQEEINALIVENAKIYGNVVRLKGGDPFVFGRGQEEIAYAYAYGIESTVIPGISSSIAVPELQKIPVTARGYAESFWVVTGTTKDGELSQDLPLAAQSTATVVILMGLGKLPQIVQTFLQHRDGKTPVAVIQNGTLPNEKCLRGTLNTIEGLVLSHEIKAPAIIVIGQVVHVHQEMVENIIERGFKNSL
ncbi:MAG: uroporphyrinogen-III C-methyltransferase [Flavobacteriales bacterium]